MAFDLSSAKPDTGGFDLSSAKPDTEAPKEVKKDEPGWFMPGSKSEAAVRGFSQAATMGFGDELQAYLRGVAKEGKYSDNVQKLKEEERTANANAAQANPMSYIAGGVVGAAPQALNIGAVARNASTMTGSKLLGAAGGAGAGGTYGAVQGAGQAETMSDVPSEMLKQGAVGAATGALQGSLAGQATPKTVPPRAPGKETLGKEIVDAALDKGKEFMKGSAARHVPGWLGAASGGAAGYSSGDDPYSKIANTAVGAATGFAVGEATSKAPSISKVAQSKYGSAAAVEPFKRISDYISQTRNATNPEVQAIAREAQAMSGNDDDKRKAAMGMQASPTGRAVTNSNSPVRDIDN